MVRLTLTLLAVAAVVTAAYFIWDIEQRERNHRAALGPFETAHWTAVREVYELRAAQQAYVAAGQGEDYWYDKAASTTESVRASLAVLESATPSAAAHRELAAAAKALQAFEQADRRARSYTRSGQKLLASDIIYSDGFESTARITTALDSARAAVLEEGFAASADARRQQAAIAAAAGGCLLIVIVTLLPTGRSDPTSATAASAAPRVEGAPELDLSLRPTGEVTAKPMPAPPPVPAPSPSAAAIEIQRLADVCSDLARLSDTDALPGILERTARALDASGLILWVANPDGSVLVPIAAYGYATTMLSRLGTIKADAENATAAAFRTGLLQTVAARGAASAAIAAPLVTASGCRGVMTAEVRGESHPDRGSLAASSIVAAQLATLVGPATDAAGERAAL